MKKNLIVAFVALGAFFCSCGKSKNENATPSEEFSKYATMVKIPDAGIEMMSTEVTQELYEWEINDNPSRRKGKKLPVECVSWYAAIYFCNALSEKLGYEPVYYVNGVSDVTEWEYVPHIGNRIEGKIGVNKYANGFRLPTDEEWEYAKNGGENYKYAGSDNLNEVAWTKNNSRDKTHPVAKKKPNGYGLYDMLGNVSEWGWFGDKTNGGAFDDELLFFADGSTLTGFRVARTVD